MRLTELGEGTQDTRRRISIRELIPPGAAVDAEQIQTVLVKLADARLIITGEGTVEVAHEALIREWPALREWLASDREGLRLHRHLTEAAQEWELLERDPGALYRGTRLNQAVEWAMANPRALNAQEQAYLETSREAAEHEQSERDAARQRELEAAQKLAETEKARAEAESQRAEEQGRSAKRLRRRAWLLAGVLTLALVLAGAAIIFGRQANTNADLASQNLAVAQTAEQRALGQQATAQSERVRAESEAQQRATAEAIAKQKEQEARSRYLTSIAEKTLLSDSQLSAHLALEAIKADPTYNRAESALHQVLPELRLVNSTAIKNTIGEDTRWLIRDGELFIWLTPEGIKVVDRVAGTDTMIAQGRNCDVVYPTEDGRWLVASCLKEEQLTDVPEYEHQVWEIETQRLLFTLPCPDTILTFGIIAPSPIHSLLVYATFPDASIHVWEVSSGKELFVLRGHSLTPELGYSNADMIASQDGKILATYGLDGMVILWDGESGDQLLQFNAQSAEIGSIDFSPDGLHLATSGFDETIKIWDITSLTTGPVLERTISNISQGWTTIMYSPDGTRLASGVEDNRVKVWDAQTGELLMTLTGIKGDAWVISFSQDGSRLYTNSADRTIKEWDLSPGKELMTLSGMIIGSAPFSPDGTKLAVSGVDGSLSIVDSQTGAVLQSWQAHSDWMTDIAWSPDGNRLATSNGFSVGWWWDFPIGDNTAKIWDTSTGQLIQEIPGEGYAGFTHLAWSPDSSSLVTTSWISGTTYIRDAESWDEVITHTVPPGDSFWSLAYSPDGQKIVSGSNTSIFVWDAATGTEVFTQTLDHTPLGLAFSPDGQLLAVSHMDGTIKLFTMTDVGLNLERILSGGDQSIYTVDFSTDGTLLAAGNISGVVRVWDLSTMQIRFEVATFTGPVSWVAFSPDGRRLFASNLSGTTYVYVLPLDELIELVSSRIVLPMTEEECWEYL